MDLESLLGPSVSLQAPVAVRLTRLQQAKLRILAKRQHRSVGSIIRQSIDGVLAAADAAGVYNIVAEQQPQS